MNMTDGRPRRPTAEQYRARQRLVPDLLHAVERRGDPRIPWRALPALATAFGDDEDVLRHLVGVWSRALAGRVDGLLDDPAEPAGPVDLDHVGRPRDAVERAAAELAAARPALHAVLAQYAEHPVVLRAAARDAAAGAAPDARAHAQHIRPRPAPRPLAEPAAA